MKLGRLYILHSGNRYFNGNFLQSNGRFDTCPRNSFCSSSPKLSKTSLFLKIREDSESWRTVEEETHRRRRAKKKKKHNHSVVGTRSGFGASSSAVRHESLSSRIFKSKDVLESLGDELQKTCRGNVSNRPFDWRNLPLKVTVPRLLQRFIRFRYIVIVDLPHEARKPRGWE
jgi:hypothetical protein